MNHHAKSSIAAALLVFVAAGPAECESLAQASKAFDDAQLHHDGASIDRFLAADFVFITRSGKILGRKDFIEGTTTPGEKLEPFVIRDHRVEPLGRDGGVVSGEGLVRGTRDGKRFTSHFRYADVFARRNGHWTVVYVQVTGLPNP